MGHLERSLWGGFFQRVGMHHEKQLFFWLGLPSEESLSGDGYLSFEGMWELQKQAVGV